MPVLECTQAKYRENFPLHHTVFPSLQDIDFLPRDKTRNQPLDFQPQPRQLLKPIKNIK